VLCASESAPEISALTPAQVLIWPVDALRELAAREPSLEQGAGHVIAQALEEARHERLERFERSISGQLARLLARFADEGGRFEGTLPVTQTDLASLLGVRRETVCTHLGKLEAQGLLERHGKRWCFDAARLSNFGKARGEELRLSARCPCWNFPVRNRSDDRTIHRHDHCRNDLDPCRRDHHARTCCCGRRGHCRSVGRLDPSRGCRLDSCRYCCAVSWRTPFLDVPQGESCARN
jgi:Crp-like helix-turn-helix domain